MDELLITKMLQPGTIVVFNGYDSLALYHQGADHNMHPIKPLQDFMKKKDLDEIYVWSDSEDMGPANAFAEGFYTAEYGYNPNHTRYASNPIEFLNTLRDELGITNDDIVFVGNDSETLAYVEIDGDYLSASLPSFLMMDNTITVLDANSIVPELIEMKKLKRDPYWVVTGFLTHTKLENVYIRATTKEIVQIFQDIACEPEHVDTSKLHFIVSDSNPLEFMNNLKDTLNIPAENMAYVPYNNCCHPAERTARNKIKNDTDYMLVFYAQDL